MKIAIAGTEGYIGVVLRPFVEQFSSKPLWQSYLRFLIIPLGKSRKVTEVYSFILGLGYTTKLILSVLKPVPRILVDTGRIQKWSKNHETYCV